MIVGTLPLEDPDSAGTLVAQRPRSERQHTSVDAMSSRSSSTESSGWTKQVPSTFTSLAASLPTPSTAHVRTSTSTSSTGARLPLNYTVLVDPASNNGDTAVLSCYAHTALSSDALASENPRSGGGCRQTTRFDTRNCGPGLAMDGESWDGCIDVLAWWISSGITLVLAWTGVSGSASAWRHVEVVQWWFDSGGLRPKRQDMRAGAQERAL
ncbi:hypothetical protein BJ742DRAFT_856720 [Cladochytrium replicatum]|nr:hypothetical protein BJ742DRAFT_856720 [Cladochytrium replicatum]